MWLYAGTLILIGCTVIVGGIRSNFGDWPGYVRAGATVGTPQLLHPPPGVFPFLYLPAFAWLFAPLAGAAPGLGYALNGLVMAGCALGAGALCGRIYGVRRLPAMLLVLAWSPTMYGIAIGQTGALGLLLATLCTLGSTRGAVVLTALPAALLLYKPTYALPLLAVLVLRRRLRELGIAVLAGAFLFLISVAAAAGDWRWPLAWSAGIRTWFPLDITHSAAKAISTTSLLIHAGVPAAVTAAFVLLVVVVAVPLILRLPIEEAAALALALGIVVSVHALTYEGIMLVPLLFVATTRLPEPWRTPLVGSAYVLAALAPYADEIGVNALALLVPVLGLGSLVVWYRARAVADSGPRTGRMRQ